jgi:hypothetical protein
LWDSLPVSLQKSGGMSLSFKVGIHALDEMVGVPEFNRKTEQDKGERKGEFN